MNPCLAIPVLVGKSCEPVEGVLLKIFFLFSLLLLILAVPRGYGAERPPSESVDRPMHEALRVMKLNLEQKEKMRAIRQNFQERRRNIKAELDRSREELDRLLDTGADDEQLKKAFDQLQTRRRSLEAERFHKVLAIRSVLNEEQKMIFQSKRKELAAAPASTTKAVELRSE